MDSLVDLHIFEALSIIPGPGRQSVKAAEEKGQQESGRRTPNNVRMAAAHCPALIVHVAQHSTAQHSTAQHSTAQHSTAQHSTPHHSTPHHTTGQHSTAQHSTAQHSTAQHSTAQHSTAQHSTAQHRTAQHSTAQHSTAQHSTAQHSTAQHSTAPDQHQHQPRHTFTASSKPIANSSYLFHLTGSFNPKSSW